MNYISYDDLGIVEVRCMNCGIPIIVRDYKTVKTKSIPPKEVKVMVMRTLSSFRKRHFDLEDGAYMSVMICSECENIEIDPEKMEQTVKDGWQTTWENEGKNPEVIKERLNKIPKIKK